MASNPDYDVIISTHYYLTSSGAIGATNAGFGDTTPAHVWKNLVRPYPDVELVFSGDHTGEAREARVDTGAKGDTIYSFLTTRHDRTTDPTRIVTIATRARTLRTGVYASKTKRSWSECTQTIEGLTFVK